MKFSLSSLLLLAAAAIPANAGSVEMDLSIPWHMGTLPKCAPPCIMHGIEVSGCEKYDLRCICMSTLFNLHSKHCLLNHCVFRGSQLTRMWMDRLCLELREVEKSLG